MSEAQTAEANQKLDTQSHPAFSQVEKNHEEPPEIGWVTDFFTAI